ncbi:MAG: helix-turn-helix transcriptional regulator [Burkholderiales bacterium]|nr:helix-turn-helix transcriptional regulator [Burkholderiales bacterium]
MNIATALKNEIVRLARKELRRETRAMKKAMAGYRAEIAALKRRTLELEKALRRQGRRRAETVADGDAPGAEAGSRLRFSAKGLAAQRKRLGLSASDFGRLIGTSGQSIYNWESGQIRPRTAQLASIAAVRALGKREAAARLEALRAAP